MKVKIITAALVTITIFTAKQSNAQDFPHAGIYVHALYGTALDKSSKNLYDNGIGATGGFTYGKNDTRFVGSVGYVAFNSALAPGDPNFDGYGDKTYIPVRIGLRQYLPSLLNFLFIQGDAGAGFVSYKSNPANETHFAFDIGAGTQFGPFEAALMWDSFTEKHPDGWSSWLTIQVGIDLGL